MTAAWPGWDSNSGSLVQKRLSKTTSKTPPEPSLSLCLLPLPDLSGKHVYFSTSSSNSLPLIIPNAFVLPPQGTWLGNQGWLPCCHFFFHVDTPLSARSKLCSCVFKFRQRHLYSFGVQSLVQFPQLYLVLRMHPLEF